MAPAEGREAGRGRVFNIYNLWPRCRQYPPSWHELSRTTAPVTRFNTTALLDWLVVVFAIPEIAEVVESDSLGEGVLRFPFCTPSVWYG